jgi:hypothetical protein
MASAWGETWLAAWGNSWGDAGVAPPIAIPLFYQGGDDTHRRVRDYWDRFQQPKNPKPGVPKTSKKRRQPLPDASPAAKTVAAPVYHVVTAAERALARIETKVRPRGDHAIVSRDEQALMKLLLSDDD